MTSVSGKRGNLPQAFVHVLLGVGGDAVAIRARLRAYPPVTPLVSRLAAVAQSGQTPGEGDTRVGEGDMAPPAVGHPERQGGASMYWSITVPPASTAWLGRKPNQAAWHPAGGRRPLPYDPVSPPGRGAPVRAPSAAPAPRPRVRPRSPAPAASSCRIVPRTAYAASSPPPCAHAPAPERPDRPSGPRLPRAPVMLGGPELGTVRYGLMVEGAVRPLIGTEFVVGRPPQVGGSRWVTLVVCSES